MLQIKNRKTVLIVIGVTIIGVLEAAATYAYISYRKTGTIPFLPSGNPFARFTIWKPSPRIPQNALNLTSPVYSLLVTVKKIEGNSLTVTQTVRGADGAPPHVRTSKNDTYDEQESSQEEPEYIVLLTDATRFDKPPLSLPYYFYAMQATGDIQEAENQNAGIWSAQDISPGQILTVTTETDLRTIASNTFEASRILLPAIQNSVWGTIDSVEKNTIRLLSGLEGQTYTITVDDETQIAYLPFNAATDKNGVPQAMRMSMADLKPGLAINAYSDTDIAGLTTFTAVLLEPTFSPARIQNPLLPPETVQEGSVSARQ